MENKYVVVNEERVNDKIVLYTIIDIESKKDYSCLIEEDSHNNVKVLVDDLANIYDVGEALFQYDLDLFPLLPLYMITPSMENEYNDYHPGKGRCSFIDDENYEKAYRIEEKRIEELNTKVKKLVK